MSKFSVQMVDADTGDVMETMEETFDTEEEAEDYALECANDFSVGAEVLEDAGESFTSPSDVDFTVEEV